TAATLGFAHTLGEFGVVLMIGGNIPGATDVVSIAIYDHVEQLEYGAAHVLSGVLLLFSFVALLALRTWHERGVMRNAAAERRTAANACFPEPCSKPGSVCGDAHSRSPSPRGSRAP